MAKNFFATLRLGALEAVLLALMVVGIIGYFFGVPADLDWMDHTISFVLFTYLFYRLNITSILFGKTSMHANLLIVLGFFFLFFKDILRYTVNTPGEFHLFAFLLNPFLALIDSDPFLLETLMAASFYVGAAILIIASAYLARTLEPSHPSLSYALFHHKRSKARIFLEMLFLLFAFYYFVYGMILEWLEFVLDDPIIFIGILYFIHAITRHRERFHASTFVFRIGEFSEKLYTRFISLFHYKRTIPLGIAGLLVLHLLSDMAVYWYSLSFNQGNFYLEQLEAFATYTSFPTLFFSDVFSLGPHSLGALSLGIVYALNSLALFFLLAIPVVAWWQLFSQREFHLGRFSLFLMYSSFAAFLLAPAFVVDSLHSLNPSQSSERILYPHFSQKQLQGVSIEPFSPFAKEVTIFSALSLDMATHALLIAALSIFAGLCAAFIGRSKGARKELFALSIIIGFLFMAYYLFEFVSSITSYYLVTLPALFSFAHILGFIVLFKFFVLSLLFYGFGFLLFCYEVIMEYHRRRWSDPVDEELVVALRKLRSLEKRIAKRVFRKRADSA